MHAEILVGRGPDELGRLDREPLLADLPLGGADGVVRALLDGTGVLLELVHPPAEPLRLGGWGNLPVSPDPFH